ncbi:hypothetical protein MMC25_007983 [Agyrium rufum]|nr:hypothetical protein [Agyrium rufum]
MSKKWVSRANEEDAQPSISFIKPASASKIEYEHFLAFKVLWDLNASGGMAALQAKLKFTQDMRNVAKKALEARPSWTAYLDGEKEDEEECKVFLIPRRSKRLEQIKQNNELIHTPYKQTGDRRMEALEAALSGLGVTSALNTDVSNYSTGAGNGQVLPPRAKDEQIVNTALRCFLMAVTAIDPTFKLKWSLHRKMFKLVISVESDADFVAHTDGFLEGRKTGRDWTIIECKAGERKSSASIRMQESARMASWIRTDFEASKEPRDWTNKGPYARV